MVLRESDLNGYCPKGKVFVCVFGERKDLKGERGKPIYWWMLFELTLLFLSWAGAVNRSFPLSPPPNHTPLYLLPLVHGPTMSYIGWVQAGGAWALRVLPFQICPRVCLPLMCLPQPGDSPSAFPGLSCGLSFGFSLQSEAGPRMIMGFTFLWPTFGFLYCLPRWLVIPTVMTQSCWTPFWASFS